MEYSDLTINNICLICLFFRGNPREKSAPICVKHLLYVRQNPGLIENFSRLSKNQKAT
jgi:hypothetical protein